MRFQEVYEGWRERRLSQSEAAEILGVCERSFRRYTARYEDGEGDLNSLADKRLSQVSKRKAATGEIGALIALYQSRFLGMESQALLWPLPAPAGGAWTASSQLHLGQERLARRQPGAQDARAGKHHKKRDPKPLVGMMIHQDASTHAWVHGAHWDLVVTMDDATSEHLSMFLLLARRHGIELSRYRADHCPLWPVLQFLYRPGRALLHHPGGWGQSR